MDSVIPTASSAHILFVDSNPFSLQNVLRALGSAMFRATVVSDGLTGYEKAISLQPDVIVTDLTVPRLDGIPLCRRLKANSLTADIPVLFYSDRDDPYLHVQSLETGAADFISKSRFVDEVVARIRVHASISQRLNRARKQEQAATPSDPLLAPGIVLDNDDAVVVRIIAKYAQDNLAEDLSLRRLCSLVSMNKKRLNRAFQNVCGCSAFEYIRDLRMKTAKHLLANTSLRTFTIAEEVGFSNSANFATAFLTVQGMTPLEYRQQMKRNRIASQENNNSGMEKSNSTNYPSP